MTKETKKAFTARNKDYNSGFTIKFANNYTISVQFGDANYSDSGHNTAEVGVWNEKGDWYKLTEGDDVAGWQTPEEVLAIMNKISAL
jgi:hypothetical protein